MFDLFDYLTKELDFELEVFDNDENFYVFNKKIKIRVIDDRIQFGVKETFDRWANSVDFEYKKPFSKKKKFDLILDEVMNSKRCKQQIGFYNKKKRYCSNWVNLKEYLNNKGICSNCLEERMKKSKKKRKSFMKRGA